MPFRFTLDPVLRFRRGMEEQQERLLAEANRKVAQAERALLDLDGYLAESADRNQQDLGHGLTSAELQLRLKVRAALLEWRLTLAAERTKRETERAGQLNHYRHARRQREVMESLRDSQLVSYRREQVRREQIRLDEMFLLQKQFASRG